jgi:hypothetical protein
LGTFLVQKEVDARGQQIGAFVGFVGIVFFVGLKKKARRNFFIQMILLGGLLWLHCPNNNQAILIII